VAVPRFGSLLFAGNLFVPPLFLSRLVALIEQHTPRRAAVPGSLRDRRARHNLTADIDGTNPTGRPTLALRLDTSPAPWAAELLLERAAARRQFVSTDAGRVRDPHPSEITFESHVDPGLDAWGPNHKSEVPPLAIHEEWISADRSTNDWVRRSLPLFDRVEVRVPPRHETSPHVSEVGAEAVRALFSTMNDVNLPVAVSVKVVLR
jgi:hypothetical protein